MAKANRSGRNQDSAATTQNQNPPTPDDTATANDANVTDDTAAEEQSQDAFREYQAKLEEQEIPTAENDVNMKDESYEIHLEMRRNQLIHFINLEENQREYQAISFNISALMAKNAEEANNNILGFVQKKSKVDEELLKARNKIKAMKTKLTQLEESARRIEDSIDDSKHSEQTKILRARIKDGDGKKNIDEALKEIVAQSDEANNLADDTREKEIIIEGIAAYVDATSMTGVGAGIKQKAADFKTDIDNNVKEAFDDVKQAKDEMVTDLTELAAADMARDRSELHLNSLNNTNNYLDEVVGPDEDIQQILQEVENTFDQPAQDDDDNDNS